MGPALCSLKSTPSHWWPPPPAWPEKGAGGAAAGSLETQTGQSCTSEAPCQGPLSLFTLPRSLVQMAAGSKDEKYLTTPARVGFKVKTPTRTQSTAELPGQRMGAVGPGRDVGAGQIAKGESVEGGRRSQPRRKEKALYYSSSFSLGGKENFPRPRPQYFIGQTQGTWFELTERERPSPPVTHSRKSYLLLPGSSTATHPSSREH